MSRSGVNLAVTTDGEAYNRLRRPDNYIASLTNTLPGERVYTEAIVGEVSKRKLEDADISASGSDQEPESKRPKEELIEKPSVTQKPLIADTRRISRPTKECGMQSMFPGLDDNDSADDSTQDALAYLRSVRSEASTIPRYLVAATEIEEDEEDRAMYGDGHGDFRAWYNDGTWVAVDLDDDAGYSDDSHDVKDLSPQEAYYRSLLNRYTNLRETLANADPKELAILVEADPEKYANVKIPSRRKQWLNVFEATFPTPALVAQITENKLYNALEFCTESLDCQNTISKKKSCWIWTLLALVGERGTLDYFRAGRVRELGQKAGQMGVGLRRGATIAKREDNEGNEVEEWEVDGQGTDGEDAGDEADDETNEVEEAGPSKKSTNPQLPPTVGGGGADMGLRLDGTDGQEHDATPHAVGGDAGDESADMSLSEEDGEIQEEEEPIKPASEPSELEAARARLLAQLGGRLVTTSIPPSTPDFKKHGESRAGGRHRHNGKTSKDTNSQGDKRRQKAHGTTAYPEESSSPPAKVYPSREEAEKQRQKLREEELRRQSHGELAFAEESAETKTQRVSSSSSLSDDARKSIEQAELTSLPLTAAETKINAGHGHGPELDSESKDVVQVDLNTRVTIDMILTVVAECYGQKDLLRYREVW
ncbi:hypothetical protein CC80DRAFT_596419 [Byssothecium circinans]|uniref:Uncharacterized protein n=1 Tax=Byssothecium circinans TaxID=147558 RepID=A0A6A5TIZ5_9PLEO|nr:hypothetical protein CC80DRAFT_596419 [Byssothecium circinans]